MKSFLIICLFLCLAPITYAYEAIQSDCSTVIGLGQLCLDKDDAKIYIGNGAACTEIGSGGSGDITSVGNCTTAACPLTTATFGAAGTPTNYIIDKNLFYNNNANGTVGTNPEYGNPLFINPANGDFSLQSNSPAINISIDWGQTRDFIGNIKQGSGWDIGAYEYTSGNIGYSQGISLSGVTMR